MDCVNENTQTLGGHWTLDKGNTDSWRQTMVKIGLRGRWKIRRASVLVLLCCTLVETSNTLGGYVPSYICNTHVCWQNSYDGLLSWNSGYYGRKSRKEILTTPSPCPNSKPIHYLWSKLELKAIVKT